MSQRPPTPLPSDPLPNVPLIESPLFDRLIDQLDLSEVARTTALALHRDGLAVIDFPEPEFDAIAARIVSGLEFVWEPWLKREVDGLRIQDAWQRNEDVKRLAINQGILDLLSEVYQRRAFAFQTLNFPVGTQQEAHSDSAHFSSVPERFMCGVWVALEDISPEAGPLLYYPGSHRLPIVVPDMFGRNPSRDQATHFGVYDHFLAAWRSIRETHGLREERVCPKRGQAVIWAANLLHGGAPQSNLELTRHSQVTHYYFAGCAYYTPMGSAPFLGRIFYRRPIDVTTGQVVPNIVNGEPVPELQIQRAMGEEPPTPHVSLSKELGRRARRWLGRRA